MSEPNHIFVYGTLKRGYCNEGFMRHCGFVANATVPYKMFAMVREGVAPNSARVVSAPMLSREAGVCNGEVWKLPPANSEKRKETLDMLDYIEGVAYGWYSREIIKVTVERPDCDTASLSCFVYFHNAPQGEVMETWSDE